MTDDDRTEDPITMFRSLVILAIVEIAVIVAVWRYWL